MVVYRKQMPNGSPSKNYYYDFYVGSTRFRGSTKKSVEREAEQVEAGKKAAKGELHAQVDEKAFHERRLEQLSGGRRLSLEEAWGRFVHTPRRHSPGDREAMNHEARWNDFRAFMVGEHPTVEVINDVTPQMAGDYIHHVRTAGRYSKRISYRRSAGKPVEYTHRIKRVAANTANMYLLTCKMVFAALQDEAAMEANPFAAIPPLDTKGKIAKREVYTLEELVKIEGAARGKWFYPVFMVGVNTGLSEGDICTLRWSEVSSDCGLISTDRNKTAADLRIPCMPALETYLKALKREGEFVFPELARRYLTSKTGRRADGMEKVTYPLRAGIGGTLTRFLEGSRENDGSPDDGGEAKRNVGLGIESTRKIEGRDRRASVRDAHSLRHTFIYLAGMFGIPLPLVQSLVGHLTPEMTKMYMDHATDEAKREAMKRMPNLLSGGKAMVGLPQPAGSSRLVDDLRAKLKDASVDELRALQEAIAVMVRDKGNG